MTETLDDTIINYGENKGKTFDEVKKKYLEKCYQTNYLAFPDYKWGKPILDYIKKL